MDASAGMVWAKLGRDADKRIIAALPLVDHGLDVSAVFAAMLDGGAWERVLAQAAGRALTAQDKARLTLLAALHDIGKANAGFQGRRVRGADVIGHEREVSALLFDPVLRQTAAGQALIAILRDWGAGPYLSALMAHHGRPRLEYGPRDRIGYKDQTPVHRGHWQVRAGYDPVAAAADVIAQLCAQYPLAMAAGPKLPDEPRFVALFAGLLVLADWTGSDERRFPVAGPHGAQRAAMRVTQAADAVAARGLGAITTPAGDFQAALVFPPHAMQTAAAADDLGPIALIEAETGSGKTEAALWRWLELRRRGQVDGLFFALPTRSAAVQLHRRVDAVLKRVWGGTLPGAVLAVPGYLKMGDVDGHALPGRAVRWDDRADGAAIDARWAAEHANQYLAARVAVGTIDQALLGALKVRHAPVRAAALARSLLVVDEVHASDAYMTGLLERLIANHVGTGGQVLLLSATLGGATRARLLGQKAVPTLAEAVATPYPALSGRDAPPRAIMGEGRPAKQVTIETAGLIADPEAIATRAIAAARAGASVLVVRNTVGGAVAVAQAVEAAAPELAFQVEGVATLHHGRFAREDRVLLDTAVEHAFGKGRSAAGRILVGTQTLEQSLDIDADLLLTDLAPMDVLLQRIGRLHRHDRKDRGAFAAAHVVVLRPAERDLTPLLGKVRERHGLGPAAHGGPYPDLLQIEATLRLLEVNPVVSIPADNRRLVEEALHPEVLARIAADRDAAWQNHASARAGSVYADGATARGVSLDLSVPFREHLFPDGMDAVATRLGARDLIVDLDEPVVGPFGQLVRRLTIPHWMSGTIAADEAITGLATGPDGWQFGLGERRFGYGRWGLERIG